MPLDTLFVQIVGSAFDQAMGCRNSTYDHKNLWCFWPPATDPPCDECQILYDAIVEYCREAGGGSREASRPTGETP